MKKVLHIIIAVVLFLYMMFGIVFMTDRHESERLCRGVEMSVSDSLDRSLVTFGMIMEILNENWLDPTGKTVGGIDLDKMEKALETHPFIYDAQCYLTAADYLKVDITTKAPLVRVMNNNGQSYYVDSNGEILPVRLIPVDVPVATGYIDREYAKGPLLDLVKCIDESRFWKAQIEQINISQKGQVELVPRVGKQLLVLGSSENAADKLDRLMTFYMNGLNRVGWNKYSQISVAYDGQVVCKKRK